MYITYSNSDKKNIHVHFVLYASRTTTFIICCADGMLDMDPIVTVEEGQDVMVCISLMSLGSILGCPLTVDLNTTGSIKAGSIYYYYLKHYTVYLCNTISA